MTLDVAVADGVGTITINRPDKRNAMSRAMWDAIPELLDGLAADPSVRVVVLTGAGENFSAGADIEGVFEKLGDTGLSAGAEKALIEFPKPAIAMIRGFCVGGGVQLAAACDLRFAADNARFGVTPAKLGIIYPARAVERLMQLIGPSAAKYLLFSADLIDAGHALRIGLLDETVPADELAGRVAAFCASIVSRSQLTVVAMKLIVDTLLDEPGYVAEVEAEALAEVVRQGVDGDTAEGIAAFRERRPPEFGWTVPADWATRP
jgi:enoyl-CoA hydratase/carnithine racemase